MKKLFLTTISTIALIFCSAFFLTINVAGKQKASPILIKHQKLLSEENHFKDLNNNTVFTLLTLNIAHGRKDGVSQIFQKSNQIKSNLDDISSLLKRESPDIIALQEADGPSIWSGNFSHVKYLAENSGYIHSVRGAHVDGMMLSYGTALLSKQLLDEPISVTFEPSPPTFPKGFLSASIKMNNEIEADIISVHLDFSRKDVRQKQVQNMVNVLSAREKPLIIMGDFNCEWEENSAVKVLAEKLDLSIYQLTNNNQITFPILKKRIDFILISNEFEFVTYKVLPDIVSDHLGVISKIKIKDNNDRKIVEHIKI
jgi:endonuclease/exonuclease/phosphatase family metal-dependent hydrolase